MGQTDEVRFGIIGLGRGVYGAKDIKYTEGAKLVSVCDLQEEKAKEVAKEFNCEWTTDYKKILERKDIDVVGIYTSSGTHCKFATESLNAGKHTYVTKPMDIRVDPCNMAIDAADKNGLILAVEFNRRYNEKFQKMAEDIHGGKIGRILLGDLRIKWYRDQAYYEGGFPPGWRKRSTTEGGSAANQGVHSIDLFMWFIGKIKNVYGRKLTLNHDIEVEDTTASILSLENGGIATIVTTICANPPSGDIMEINGDKDTVLLKDEPRPYESKEPEREMHKPEGRGKNVVEDMVLAIKEGVPVRVDGREGRKSVELIEAIYKSSDTGKVIPLKYQ